MNIHENKDDDIELRMWTRCSRLNGKRTVVRST